MVTAPSSPHDEISELALSEFSLIQHYFAQLTPPRADVLLGIGDDCALLQCADDHSMAVSIDTLVAGVHFFGDVDPESLGHKSLAVGLSDLAAMGATPAWFTLALTLPELNEGWLQGFSQGLATLAKQYNIQLVGGDTTKGALTISVQVHGFVKQELALRRDTAQAGDLIYVTGTLGDAGAGLQLKRQQLATTTLQNQDKSYLQRRLERPSPRIDVGQKLLGIASSAVDISDGLLADLGHILAKSEVGATIQLSQIPLSAALRKLNSASAQQLALSSGDDYELCFTIAPEYQAKVEDLLAKQCTQIGVINTKLGVAAIDQKGKLITLQAIAYDHFST